MTLYKASMPECDKTKRFIQSIISSDNIITRVTSQTETNCCVFCFRQEVSSQASTTLKIKMALSLQDASLATTGRGPTGTGEGVLLTNGNTGKMSTLILHHFVLQM